MACADKGNVLEVEVTNLGANRLRWNDLNGVDWKYFGEKYFESARHFYECLVGEPRTFEIGLRARF